MQYSMLLTPHQIPWFLCLPSIAYYSDMRLVKCIVQCDFCCLHKTQSSETAHTKLSSRNTGCAATLKVILKKTEFSRKGAVAVEPLVDPASTKLLCSMHSSCTAGSFCHALTQPCASCSILWQQATLQHQCIGLHDSRLAQNQLLVTSDMSCHKNCIHRLGLDVPHCALSCPRKCVLTGV